MSKLRTSAAVIKGTLGAILLIFRVLVKSLAVITGILGKIVGLFILPLKALWAQAKKLFRFSLTFKITATYAFLFTVLLFFSSILTVTGLRLYLVYALHIEDNYTGILLVVLLTVNIITVIITVIIGARVSRRMLLPIKLMTDTVKDISAQNLDMRLDVGRAHDELKDLAETFNQMIDRIQDSYDRQNRFVSDASHELRTPVSVIKGYADLLDRWGKDHRDIVEESVGAIKGETDNMKELIEKLLFLARADKNQIALQVEEFIIDELLEEIVAESRLLNTGHCIGFDSDTNRPISLNADRGYLKQALRIFIDNSIKYTPTGGSIDLRLSVTKKHVIITIADTGAGIPKEDIPHIFDRFYRADQSRAKGSGGHGLGLSIAKWIIDGHNGKNDVQSTINSGTRISIYLPATVTRT
jgi:two-component system sensor histidine kinase ArlS